MLRTSILRTWRSCLLPAVLPVVLMMMAAGIAVAQHGYPLVGSWHGTWTPEGGGPGDAQDITLILRWDGKDITGIINPGFNAMSIEDASLDAMDGWALHLEADTNEDSGPTERVILDGHLENVANVNREIVGTWKRGSRSGLIRFVRDY